MEVIKVLPHKLKVLCTSHATPNKLSNDTFSSALPELPSAQSAAILRGTDMSAQKSPPSREKLCRSSPLASNKILSKEKTSHTSLHKHAALNLQLISPLCLPEKKQKIKINNTGFIPNPFPNQKQQRSSTTLDLANTPFALFCCNGGQPHRNLPPPPRIPDTIYYVYIYIYMYNFNTPELALSS